MTEQQLFVPGLCFLMFNLIYLDNDSLLPSIARLEILHW